MHWRGADHHIVVGGFGGAPPLTPATGRGRQARAQRRRRLRRAQSAGVGLGPRFDELDAESAFLDGEPMDILLTHGGPHHEESFVHGCGHLARLANRVQPRVHLFGHHHQVVGPVASEHGGQLIGLEHLEFMPDGALRDGSWGILELEEDQVRFDWMCQRLQSWMQPFRRRSWRVLLPKP